VETVSQTPAEKFFWRKDPTADARQAEEVTRETKASSPAESTAKKVLTKSSGVVVGIPCHDSEQTIGKTIIRVLPLGADVVVCDDGSSDTTEEIAAKMGCRVIKHPRELGRSDAITSIYLAAKKMKAEVLLTVGVDSNFSLTDAARLIDSVQKEDVDIAIGSSTDREAVDQARHDGRISDKASLFRAYSKKALTMISPPGTGSVVVEKEVLEFADQQGLRVREYPTTVKTVTSVKQQAKTATSYFETRFLDYVAVKHPLVFLGIPSIGFLYGAVFETALGASFTGPALTTIERFAISLVSSPLFIASVALSIGTAVLYSQKRILSKIKDASRGIDHL
jgi:hypothetical protein